MSGDGAAGLKKQIPISKGFHCLRVNARLGSMQSDAVKIVLQLELRVLIIRGGLHGECEDVAGRLEEFECRSVTRRAIGRFQITRLRARRGVFHHQILSPGSRGIIFQCCQQERFILRIERPLESFVNRPFLHKGVEFPGGNGFPGLWPTPGNGGNQEQEHG
jgi:hypothetical protein